MNLSERKEAQLSTIRDIFVAVVVASEAGLLSGNSIEQILADIAQGIATTHQNLTDMPDEEYEKLVADGQI